MDIRPTAGKPAPMTATPAGSAAQVASVSAASQPEASVTLEQATQAVTKINQSMMANGQGVEFSIDSDSQRTVVKVVDQQTKEVLRQMPTQEALEIAKALDRYQGLLISQKA